RAIAAYETDGASLIVKERPMRVPVALTTASFAETMGVAPALGRYFRPEEDLPGDPHVVVISHRLFTSIFRGDPETIGRHVLLDARPVTVIGVMPEGFGFPAADTEVWLPARINPASIARGNHGLNVIGRMRPGVTVEEARAEMQSLMAAWKISTP